MKGDGFIKLNARYVATALGVVISLALIISVANLVRSIVVLANERDTPTGAFTSESCLETIVASSCFLESKTETEEESQLITEETSATSVNTTTAISESNEYTITYYTDSDAINIAKVLYRECRGVPSVTEQACVVWTILNRVDNSNASIYDIISSPNQFAFMEDTPIDETLLNLAYDVLERWNCERNGETNVGRVLPESFLWFYGYGGHNYFRNQYDGDCIVWDYSLESPYES